MKFKRKNFMKTSQLFISSLMLILFSSCSQKNSEQFIVVKNALDIERSYETIELTAEFLKVDSLNNIGLKEVATGKLVITQLVDLDGNGTIDQLLFQPTIAPNSEATYEIVPISEVEKPKSIAYCYSRFVPERTDDYAWENNKVAFRTYGPTAQKMIEDSIPGGTLSSGIDAWLKKVDYPIINKWYEKTTIGTGSYHEDTGEGLDNFHVGVSRGVGGTAVKIDSTYYYSKNFTNWKTISAGPIRTSFVLNYANWDANGNIISEKKHISLDYGANLSRFEIEVSGTDLLAVGLTLHENDGESTQNNNAGWISYWQPHGNSELGSAIIVPNAQMVSSELYNTPLKDQSNLYAQIKVVDGKAIYYAGFGWKEAKEFSSKEVWEQYLKEFILKLNNPLEVMLN
jgi:hypothetical protein